jgi:3-isopropylmalate/(R)-2-methylmalate dehydratase small subunit
MPIAPIEGTAAVFGDHVSADSVLPARHSFLPPEQMAEQVLMDVGPEANRKVRTHAVIVAGEAFGYGTGRESPSRALRAAGVRAVIARSFSRLFFRNALNNGIVVIQCPALAAMPVQDGDPITVSLDEGRVHWNGQSFDFPPMSGVVSEIVEAGNLINYGRALLAKAAAGNGA